MGQPRTQHRELRGPAGARPEIFEELAGPALAEGASADELEHDELGIGRAEAPLEAQGVDGGRELSSFEELERQLPQGVRGGVHELAMFTCRAEPMGPAKGPKNAGDGLHLAPEPDRLSDSAWSPAPEGARAGWRAVACPLVGDQRTVILASMSLPLRQVQLFCADLGSARRCCLCS